jgi:hypothetical protein
MYQESAFNMLSRYTSVKDKVILVERIFKVFTDKISVKPYKLGIFAIFNL